MYYRLLYCSLVNYAQHCTCTALYYSIICYILSIMFTVSHLKKGREIPEDVECHPLGYWDSLGNVIHPTLGIHTS
jgi:hypothetical protein